MEKKKICFIAQFPPPLHGLSKAVDTLYHSCLRNEFELEKVNITDNKKFLKNILRVAASRADLFYFTISQTKGGNLRDILILLLLKLQNKKCLVHLHGGYYREMVEHDLSGWQRKLNYRLMKDIEGTIVLGESLKAIFEGMVPEERILVVPNCVDDQFLMSDEEFQIKVIESEHKEVRHVLYLSNFIREKGWPEVLELAVWEKERCLAGEKKKFHFDFAGGFFDREEEKQFFDCIQKNDLEKYVTYHGIVDGHQKQELLKTGDIFMLPTRYPREGQPISILEAMGNGLFVVTTDHAGIPDVVKHGENGIVLTKGQKILMDDMIKLSPEKFWKCAIQNREKVLALYCQDKYVDNIKNIWRML